MGNPALLSNDVPSNGRAPAARGLPFQLRMSPLKTLNILASFCQTYQIPQPVVAHSTIAISRAPPARLIEGSSTCTALAASSSGLPASPPPADPARSSAKGFGSMISLFVSFVGMWGTFGRQRLRRVRLLGRKMFRRSSASSGPNTASRCTCPGTTVISALLSLFLDINRVKEYAAITQPASD
jgi:hypothetical protein